MNPGRLYNIILAPHVSEKSTSVADQGNQYIFKVSRDANKQEIKEAVETLFKVEVAAVNVVNIRGKQKRVGRISGRRNAVKKAYVRLKAQQDIDLLEQSFGES